MIYPYSLSPRQIWRLLPPGQMHLKLQTAGGAQGPSLVWAETAGALGPRAVTRVVSQHLLATRGVRTAVKERTRSAAGSYRLQPSCSTLSVLVSLRDMSI